MRTLMQGRRLRTWWGQPAGMKMASSRCCSKCQASTPCATKSTFSLCSLGAGPRLVLRPRHKAEMRSACGCCCWLCHRPVCR